MTVSYCPRCWAPVPRETRSCPQCGADLEQRNEDYLTKLIGALLHPDYLTRRRAALILGWLRDARAVDPLMATLRGEEDPYVRAEAATALGAIGGEEADAALRNVAQDPDQSIIVRTAATQALGRRHTV